MFNQISDHGSLLTTITGIMIIKVFWNASRSLSLQSVIVLSLEMTCSSNLTMNVVPLCQCALTLAGKLQPSSAASIRHPFSQACQ